MYNDNVEQVFPYEVSAALKNPQEANAELLLDIGMRLKCMTQAQQKFLGLYAMGYGAEEIGELMDMRNPQTAFIRNIQRLTTLINMGTKEKTRNG